MHFLKLLSVVTIIISSFSSFVSAMEENLFEDQDGVSIHRPQIKRKKECTHWGLSRWVSGIGEYIDRCLGCNSHRYPYDNVDRKYVTNYKSGQRKESSDCWCVNMDANNSEGGFCQNEGTAPICLTLCCPVVTTCHLLTLPFALCDCSKNQDIETYYPPAPPYTPPPTTEELVRKAAKKIIDS